MRVALQFNIQHIYLFMHLQVATNNFRIKFSYARYQIILNLLVNIHT